MQKLAEDNETQRENNILNMEYLSQSYITSQPIVSEIEVTVSESYAVINGNKQQFKRTIDE